MNDLVKKGIAARVAQLEHEAAAYEAEAIRVERAADKRHALDRVAQLRDAIARVKAGGKG